MLINDYEKWRKVVHWISAYKHLLKETGALIRKVSDQEYEILSNNTVFTITPSDISSRPRVEITSVKLFKGTLQTVIKTGS